MFYLIGQILVCLVLAGMLGVCVGWLLRGTGAESRENRLESSWRMMSHQRESEVAELRSSAQRTRAALIASERRHKAILSSKEDEIGRLKSNGEPEDSIEDQEIAALRAQVEDLTSRLEASLPQESVREAWGDMRRLIEVKDREIQRLMLKTGQPVVAGSPAAASSAQPAQPGPVAPAAQTAASSGDDSDDLKTIYGIGPATERKLNKLGFTRFRQLASLSGNDIAQIAEALDCQPDRIERDNWKTNARNAHERKYGEVI